MFKLHFVQLMNILLLSLKDVKIKDDYSLYFDHCFYMTIFIYKNMTTKKNLLFFQQIQFQKQKTNKPCEMINTYQ